MRHTKTISFRELHEKTGQYVRKAAETGGIYISISTPLTSLVFISRTQGGKRVRALAARAPIECGIHGYAELLAVIHRKFREGVLPSSHYRQVLDQFMVDWASMLTAGCRCQPQSMTGS